jgi:rhodanese-related sulfurtransferase
MRRVLATALAACLLALASAATGADHLTKKELVKECRENAKQVNATQAKQRFDQGWHYFIDCRVREEYKKGHIPGALHIPRGFLEFKIEDFVPERDAKIIVYCKSGDRSCLGARTLQRMGYENAFSLDGGWRAWYKAGYPVE